jgi:hypothetical protein
MIGNLDEPKNDYQCDIGERETVRQRRHVADTCGLHNYYDANPAKPQRSKTCTVWLSAVKTKNEYAA